MAQRRSYLPGVLMVNLNALHHGTEAQFKKMTRVGMGSAHRLLKVGQNIRLDTLQQIAEGFSVEAWELLVPGLDAKQRPKQRLAALEQEVEILRQQIHDIRAAINGNSPAPRDAGRPDAGRPRNDTATRQTQGDKSKGD